jgi:hypothetical protein
VLIRCHSRFQQNKIIETGKNSDQDKLMSITSVASRVSSGLEWSRVVLCLGSACVEVFSLVPSILRSAFYCTFYVLRSTTAASLS